MTFKELAEAIARLTPEQQAQEVYFLEPCDDPSLFSCSLDFATGPLYETDYDEDGESFETENILVDEGNPYLA